MKKTCWSVGCNDARVWSCGGLAVVVVVGLLDRLRVGGGHGSSLVVPLVRCSLYRSQRGI